MKLPIIEDLKKAKPKKRGEIVKAMHAKNVKFFTGRHPLLAEFLQKQGTAGFELRFNDEFLDIIERKTGQYAHPQGKLLEYIERVASWHHSGWIDKLELLHQFTGVHEHGRLIEFLLQGIYLKLPQVTARMRSGEIRLPRMANGRRFSGSTVFLGALTGLHIVQYLNTTEARDVVIIEPDLYKFALSCWFVDYEAINKQFGRLVLHVGPELPENPLHYLIGGAPVTAGIWMRILPIYPSEAFSAIINRVNLRWRALHEIVVPFDREIRNLKYAAENLRNELPVLCRAATLSENSRFAVVASGPSLDQDMEWLKANQGRLVIFAAVSAVRALKKNGITPDFQCTLDTEIEDDLVKALDLDPDVPLVAYYKLDPALAKKFKTVLLIPEAGKANVVEFLQPIGNTHPTTGNLTISAAILMHPKELYLLGLDLGFREAARSHVSGGWHDDNEGAGHELETMAREQIPAPANFAESEGELFTHSYYNNSRAAIEVAVAEAGGVKVYNLSDGVKIAGTEALRSGSLEIPDYPDKAADLQAVQGAFVRGREGVWKPYSRPGREILDALRKAFETAFPATTVPDWPHFAKALDTVWAQFVIDQTREHPNDIRLEAFARLALDLLAEWYRVMVFSASPAEFRMGYTAGTETLGAVMGKLHWPSELDYDANAQQLGASATN